MIVSLLAKNCSNAGTMCTTGTSAIVADIWPIGPAWNVEQRAAVARSGGAASMTGAMEGALSYR